MKTTMVAMLVVLSTAASAKEITVQVKGMVCSMCAQGIQKKFSKISEVKDIKVNLDKKIVSIVTNGDLDIEDKKIKEIITEAGYNVASIERK